MQPLSYQTTAVTCWITSILNAILLFRGVDEIPFPVCRKLNGLALARGRYANKGVFYYTKDQLNRNKDAIAFIGKHTKLDICYRKNDDVEVAIRKLDFEHQVAVCDIHDGWHSILLINNKMVVTTASIHVGNMCHLLNRQDCMKHCRNIFRMI